MNETCKQWTMGKTSSICSVHFKPEDFTRPFHSYLKRALREDEFGVCVWPTFHVGKGAGENEHQGSPTKRQKRMPSNLLLDLLSHLGLDKYYIYHIMSNVFFLYRMSDLCFGMVSFSYVR